MKMRQIQIWGLLCFPLFLLACSESVELPAQTDADTQAVLPALPVSHTNNAVAVLSLEGKTWLFSFAGLTAGKTWQDTSKQAFMLVEGESAWQALPDLPVSEGRLAATAVGLNGRVYYFGGYMVAEDGAEKSTLENFVFDPKAQTYDVIAPMPVPVDDAVSFAYRERYIYLVSGWHDTENVRTVQVYDTLENQWFRAADYPGNPVFGHAGGIVGNRFVIADGVAVFGSREAGDRRFETVNEGWMGTISPDNPTEISYRRLPQLPGRGHYRMAGAGDVAGNRVLFVGGTPNAYNYNGVGYNGDPSAPTKHVFAWDFTSDTWVALSDKPTASMDHRGLLRFGGQWVTVGGMVAGQVVTGALLPALEATALSGKAP